MKKSDRLVALETLNKIFSDSSYSNIALDVALSQGVDDKAFVTALIYGVTERKITLDYYINKYLTSKPKPKIMMILRLGAYQILFMDKVPVSAAINESVKLAKDIKQDFYTSLINAVLRKISCDEEKVNMIDDISVHYSIPQNLINMWQKAYDKETVKEFLPCINEVPPVFAIPNLNVVTGDELVYELLQENIEAETYNGVVKILSHFDLKKSKAFNNGLFHIEDYSSYECCKTLQVKNNMNVIDVCAAPGGKTFTLSYFMNDTGEIISCDIYEKRVDLINESVNRLKLHNIKTIVNDASIFNENIEKADRILCDVPCSGLGIIRRKPEIRYKNLDEIKSLPKIQLDILKTSSKYLKDNGILVYSTCTLNKRENENVVNAFLDENKKFSLVNDKTIFPTQDGGDGFYYAVIKKCL